MKRNYPLRWDHSPTSGHSISKSELHLQAQLVQWFYTDYPEYRICTIPLKGIRISNVGLTEKLRTLLFHNLNNPKSVVEGAKLVACGLVHGRPDMTLAIARGPYFGLNIELKKPGEKPKQAQLEVMYALEQQGYANEWVDNLDDAKQLLIDYLALSQS